MLSVYENKVEVIDPRSTKHAPMLFTILKDMGQIKHECPFSYNHQQFTLTNPLFFYKHPTQKDTSYIAIFHPEPLGKGQFGSVHTIVGLLKQVEETVYYKKTTGLVVKTNAMGIPSENITGVFKTYQNDFDHGSHVPHLGYQCPPVRHQNSCYLIMRHQEGITLHHLIKHLHRDPEFLSVSDRLRVSINLLQALEQQIHGIKLSHSSPEDYLIHCDIKPKNIVVANDCSVKLIDYGLATRYSTKSVVSGSLAYLDPMLIKRQKKHPDKTTDIASMARVIAEFWGDESHIIYDVNHYYDRDRVKQMQKNLSAVPGISSDEIKALTSIIVQLTAEEDTHRLSVNKAIQLFNTLLEKRRRLENNAILGNVLLNHPESLKPQELVAVLNSPYRTLFLKQYQTAEPLINQLEDAVGLLGSEAILELMSHPMDLSKCTVLELLIRTNCLSSDALKTLITLGIPVRFNHLYDWATQVNPEDDDMEWTAICRILFKYCKDSWRLAHEIKKEPTLASIFIHDYLFNPNIPDDDLTNIRLIRKTIAGVENKLISTGASTFFKPEERQRLNAHDLLISFEDPNIMKL